MNNKNNFHVSFQEQIPEIIEKHPGVLRKITENQQFSFDYYEPQINQEEMEDYHQTISMIIRHSDTSSKGNHGSLPSHPRPDAHRILDDTIMQFDLESEIRKIKHESNWAAGTQSAKTLLKSDKLRIVLIALPRGNEMKMHQSEDPVSIQVLEGSLHFMTWNNCFEIKRHCLITLHEKVQHNIIAREQSLVLLTIMNNSKVKKSTEEGEDSKEMEEKEKEVVEKSENINFPDFPTYPPDDEIYKVPDEKVTDE